MTKEICEIRDRELGDCEIEENGEIMWRCPDYINGECRLKK